MPKTKMSAADMWVLMDLKSKIGYYGYNKLPLKNLLPLRMEVDRLICYNNAVEAVKEEK